MLNTRIYLTLLIGLIQAHQTLGGKIRVLVKATGAFSEKIEIPLTKLSNNYFGKINVGGLGVDKVFTVNFDTGSQHLWLVSKDFCKDPECKGVRYKPYNKDTSQTYREHVVKERFELMYADGTTVDGHLGWDFVYLGEGDLRLKINQTIGLADKISGFFENCDGIFGLGLFSENFFPGDPDPPLKTMFNNFQLKEFGMYLSRVADKSEMAGKLIFGGHDNDLVEGPFTWHDVRKVDGSFEGWKVKLDGIKVEKGDNKLTMTWSDKLALPDSGNNVIAGPKDVINKINQHIFKDVTANLTKTFVFFCDDVNFDNLPSFTFVIDGVDYMMSAADYIWRFRSGRVCKTGFIGVPGMDHFVLGQLFMQTFYTKYNIEDFKVAFARARHRNQ